MVSVIVDALYSDTLSKIIADDDNMGFSSFEMYMLANRRLGQTNIMGNLPVPDNTGRDRKDRALEPKDSNHRIDGRFWRSIAIDHEERTFNIDPVLGLEPCSPSLCDLWSHLSELPDQSAFDWLCEAMRVDLMTFDLSNGTPCPIRKRSQTTISPEVEVSRNLGSGIPEEVLSYYDDLNDADKRELSNIFDDIVTDLGGNSDFLMDRPGIVVTQEADENSNTWLELKQVHDFLLPLIGSQFVTISPSLNLPGRQVVNSTTLSHEEALVGALIAAFKASSDPSNKEALERQGNFFEWLKDKKPESLRWGDALIASEEGTGNPHILSILPPHGFQIGIVQGLDRTSAWSAFTPPH